MKGMRLWQNGQKAGDGGDRGWEEGGRGRQWAEQIGKKAELEEAIDINWALEWANTALWEGDGGGSDWEIKYLKIK